MRSSPPVFDTAGPCPTRLRHSDVFGDHALCCGSGGERISRHNALWHALYGSGFEFENISWIRFWCINAFRNKFVRILACPSSAQPLHQPDGETVDPLGKPQLGLCASAPSILYSFNFNLKQSTVHVFLFTGTIYRSSNGSANWNLECACRKLFLFAASESAPAN